MRARKFLRGLYFSAPLKILSRGIRQRPLVAVLGAGVASAGSTELLRRYFKSPAPIVNKLPPKSTQPNRPPRTLESDYEMRKALDRALPFQSKHITIKQWIGLSQSNQESLRSLFLDGGSDVTSDQIETLIDRGYITIDNYLMLNKEMRHYIALFFHSAFMVETFFMSGIIKIKNDEWCDWYQSFGIVDDLIQILLNKHVVIDIMKHEDFSVSLMNDLHQFNRTIVYIKYITEKQSSWLAFEQHMTVDKYMKLSNQERSQWDILIDYMAGCDNKLTETDVDTLMRQFLRMKPASKENLPGRSDVRVLMREMSLEEFDKLSTEHQLFIKSMLRKYTSDYFLSTDPLGLKEILSLPCETRDLLIRRTALIGEYLHGHYVNWRSCEQSKIAMITEVLSKELLDAVDACPFRVRQSFAHLLFAETEQCIWGLKNGIFVIEKYAQFTESEQIEFIYLLREQYQESLKLDVAHRASVCR